MTNLIIAFNCSSSDLTYGTSGIDWVDVDVNDDVLIMTQGSDVVADGETIPGSVALNQAGVVISAIAQVVPHYLLADDSEDLLKEVFLAGNQNKRYVFAFDFDGETASEPILEAWDDITLSTYNNVCLGAGNNLNSWFRGIVTTDALPGTNWVGTKLAGSADNHFLKLNNNNGALSGVKTLYCNLKMVVPASFPTAGAEAPILCVKYTSN